MRVFRALFLVSLFCVASIVLSDSGQRYARAVVINYNGAYLHKTIPQNTYVAESRVPYMQKVVLMEASEEISQMENRRGIFYKAKYGNKTGYIFSADVRVIFNRAYHRSPIASSKKWIGFRYTYKTILPFENYFNDSMVNKNSSIKEISHNNEYSIWLDKLISYSSEVPEWLVMDTLNLSKYKNYRLESADGCESPDGAPDVIIGLLDKSCTLQEGRYIKFRKAWRINGKDDKFELLSDDFTDKITCQISKCLL